MEFIYIIIIIKSLVDYPKHDSPKQSLILATFVRNIHEDFDMS